MTEIEKKHNYKYNEDICDELPDMFINGESIAEVSAALGITKQCFHNWVKEHKEFGEAYERGRTLSEAWWTKLGRAGAMGKVPIQPTVWQFNMHNRFKWTTRADVTTNGVSAHVNLEVKSEEEAAREYKKLMQRTSED